MARKFLTALDLQKNELQNAAVQNLSTAPSSPVTGQIYFNTADGSLYVYDGSAWDKIAVGAGVTFGTTASTSAVGDAASGGVATTASRSDHVHARESFGTVTSQTAFGATSTSGAATTPARSDHTHGTPALPTASDVGAVANGGNTPSISSGTLASRPAAGTTGRLYIDTTNFNIFRDNGTSWDQVAKFGTTASTQAIGDAAAAGTATDYSRSDHKHAMPSFGTVTGQTTYGAASGSGSAATIARSDHTHGTPSLTSVTPSTQAIGDAAAVGTGTAPAREDHKHAMPAFGTPTAQTSFGGTSAAGSSANVARADHTHGTPTHDATAHSAIKLSDLAAATADLSVGGFKITNLATPTTSTDAATKGYVDAAVVGIDWKPSVKVATTANITLSGTQTIDGVAVVANDRVLVKDQNTASQNGLYTVAAGAWTRTTDADTAADLTAGLAVFVEQGTVNADTGWVLTTDGTVTVDTTSLTFVQFTGLGQVVAGAGLTKTGNTLDVGAGTGITVNANDIAIDTSVVARKFSQTLSTSATSYTITHNLNTQDVVVSVYETASPYAEVGVDVEHATVNTVIVRFSTAPTANAYRVSIVG